MNHSSISRLVITVLLLLVVGFLTGQDRVKFERVEREDGSQLGHVFDVIEDEEGFIWFCTNRGFCKYDGYAFQYYLHDDEDPDSPSASWTFAGLFDRKGRIWTGTTNGVNLMDRKHVTFKRFYHDPEDSNSLGANEAFDLFEDSRGRIWVNSFSRVSVYDDATGKFEYAKLDGYKGQRFFQTIAETRDGTIWVSGEGSLFKIDPETLEGENVLSPYIGKIPKKACNARGLLVLENGNLAVSSPGGLHVYDVTKSTYKKVNLPKEFDESPFSAIVEYPKGHIMLGSYRDGLIQINLKTLQFERSYYRVPTDLEGLIVNYCYSLRTDSKNNLWVGLFRGANKLNLYARRFKVYNNVPGSESLHNYTLRVFGDSDGGVWSNTMKGVYYKPNISAASSPMSMGSFKKNKYIGLENFAEDKEGKLWFGVRKKGVFFYDRKSGRSGEMEAYNRTCEAPLIRISCDPVDPDLVWAYSDKGLYKYNQRTKKGSSYDPGTQLSGTAWKSFRSIFQSSDGTVFIPSKGGLIEFIPDSEKFNFYPIVFQDTTISTYLRYMTQVGDSLWVTSSNSLNYFDRKSGKFTSYTGEHGLYEGSIISITTDNGGNFWMGLGGLCKYSPEKKESKTFQPGLLPRGPHYWTLQQNGRWIIALSFR